MKILLTYIYICMIIETLTLGLILFGIRDTNSDAE